MADNKKVRLMAAHLRDKFRRNAVQLDGHTESVNKARVAGGLLGFVGSAVAVIGFFVLRFDAETSALTAGVVGGSIAAFGGLIAAGAKITLLIIEKIKQRELCALWDFFRKSCLQQMQTKNLQLQIVYQMPFNLVQIGLAGAEITKDLTAILTGGGAAAETTGAAVGVSAGVGGNATQFAKAFASASIVLGVIMMAISLYIVDGSLELRRKTKSKAGDALRELAEFLDVFEPSGNPQSGTADAETENSFA